MFNVTYDFIFRWFSRINDIFYYVVEYLAEIAE